MAALYRELHGIARSLMRRQPGDHTLQATALVHEAFLRLRGGAALDAGVGRAYVFAAASRAMREVLVDHARRRATAKRGRRMARHPLDAILERCGVCPGRFVDLQESLVDLAGEHDRAARIVDLRFFGGFSEAEVAAELGISVATVQRDYQFARAWLRRSLRPGDPP